MIYGRFGDPVELLRRGTLADVKRLDNRQPDKRDREVVEAGGYVVTRYLTGDRAERLHHLGYLRADGGLAEITEALQRLEPRGHAHPMATFARATGPTETAFPCQVCGKLAESRLVRVGVGREARTVLRLLCDEHAAEAAQA